MVMLMTHTADQLFQKVINYVEAKFVILDPVNLTNITVALLTASSRDTTSALGALLSRVCESLAKKDIASMKYSAVVGLGLVMVNLPAASRDLQLAERVVQQLLTRAASQLCLEHAAQAVQVCNALSGEPTQAISSLVAIIGGWTDLDSSRLGWGHRIEIIRAVGAVQAVDTAAELHKRWTAQLVTALPQLSVAQYTEAIAVLLRTTIPSTEQADELTRLLSPKLPQFSGRQLIMLTNAVLRVGAVPHHQLVPQVLCQLESKLDTFVGADAVAAADVLCSLGLAGRALLSKVAAAVEKKLGSMKPVELLRAISLFGGRALFGAPGLQALAVAAAMKKLESFSCLQLVQLAEQSSPTVLVKLETCTLRRLAGFTTEHLARLLQAAAKAKFHSNAFTSKLVSKLEGGAKSTAPIWLTVAIEALGSLGQSCAALCHVSARI